MGTGHHQQEVGSPGSNGPGSRLRWTFVVVVVAVVTLSWVLWRVLHSTVQYHADPVPRAELEPRLGRLFRHGQSNAFSGIMIESYPHGSLRSRSQISNGILHGTVEGWYTNGQLEVRESFVNGMSHGTRTKWYPNGTQLSLAMISEGKIQGTFQRWHENGTLAERIEMRDGNADGLSQAYYPSGYLKAQARLVDGKPMTQRSWADGEAKLPGTGESK
jgi:hypothetical protein